MSESSPKEFMARMNAGKPVRMFRAWPSAWLPLFVYPASWRGCFVLILLVVVAPLVFLTAAFLMGAIWVGVAATGISIVTLGIVVGLEIRDGRMD